MDRMQEEAMRRAREMQSGTLPQRNQRTPQRPRQESPPEPEVQKPREEVNLPKPSASPEMPLTELFKDKEKLLILLLIMLLSQDGTNTELVLALLYIII